MSMRHHIAATVHDEVLENGCPAGRFSQPGIYKVDMWTAERCLYTNERKPGSFLLLLAGASLWKSQETFSALIMHWNVRSPTSTSRMDRWPNDC